MSGMPAMPEMNDPKSVSELDTDGEDSPGGDEFDDDIEDEDAEFDDEDEEEDDEY